VNTESQNELIPTGPGDILRHERLQRGTSLETAAAESRIRQEHLEAIESGETAHIAQVYLNGYIRNYARYLGMPAGAIDKHMAHAHGSQPLVQSVFSTALPRSSDDRWFRGTSYVLASVVVIALVWQFTAEAVRFSQGDSVVRSQGSDSLPRDPVNTTARDNLAMANKPGAAKSHLQASIAPLEEVQRGRSEVSRSGAEGAWSAISEVTAPERAVEEHLQAGQQSFRISASADSWVEITDGNGRKIEMDLLRAGNGRDYVAVAPVKLLLGRASSIELEHNGQDIDLAPYTRGNVARITLGTPETGMEPGPQQPPESAPGQQTPAGQDSEVPGKPTSAEPAPGEVNDQQG
jgi:cytoskeleton protein RodZ